MSEIKTEQFVSLIRRQIPLMSQILQTKDSSLLLTPCEEEYFVAITHQIWAIVTFRGLALHRKKTSETLFECNA